MGFVFKTKRRAPIPAGAEIIKRRTGAVARWTSNKRTLTAAVDGNSVVIEGQTYRARWRDADGILHTASTACKSLDAAEHWLSRKVGDIERVRAGVVNQAEATTAQKAEGLLTPALDAFCADLKAKGRTPQHIRECAAAVNHAATACGWRKIRDMSGEALESYLQGRRRDDEISARSYNKALTLCAAFGRWCVHRRILSGNPFMGLSRLNQKSDRCYERRPVTVSEVTAIIGAARTRAADAWKGENRAMVYMLMATSGLRWREARSLRLSDVHLEGDTPYIELRAAAEKNR